MGFFSLLGMVRRIRRASMKGTRRRYKRRGTRSRRVGKRRVRASYVRRASTRRTRRRGRGRVNRVRGSRRGRASRRYHSRRRGMRGGNLADFGNEMLDKFMNKVSDMRDIPMEANGKIGDGVARAAEYASKWGLSGPASNVVKMVDTVSGNNPVVDGRSNLSIFDHPILSKPTY